MSKFFLDKIGKRSLKPLVKKFLFGFLITFFITSILIAFTPLANWLAPLFFIEPVLQKSDAVIVLSGGSYPNGRLTVFTIERVIDGIYLYKEGWAKKIIFVGNSENHQIPDAQKMKELAIKLGIPEEDILVGLNSPNTYFNLREAAEIMKQNEMETALLVTSSIHTKRSLLVAKKLNLALSPASFSVDQYRQVSVDRLILFWFETREAVALAVYKLRGWI